MTLRSFRHSLSGLAFFRSFIFVDIATQRLHLILNRKKIKSYPVSTSRFGRGSLIGSNKTPTGLHRIYAKFGQRLPSGAVLKDRLYTGEIWDGKSRFGNLITSRILALDGLESGINRGGRVDSRKRYIYLHGTNHEKNIGQPASHGCITLKNADMIDLFSRVRKGTYVIIV